jgi:hypothetical protein
MNKAKKIALTLLTIGYIGATVGKNVELYSEKINPLENEFTQICEEVVEEHGIPIPAKVLNSKNGPLTDIVNQRKQLVEEYDAFDVGSSWKLMSYGPNLDTGIYLWHPFHKID